MEENVKQEKLSIGLIKDTKTPLWAKLFCGIPFYIIEVIDEFKLFILSNKEIITLYGVFAALSSYLLKISEPAASYSLILLFSMSIVLLKSCMFDYKGILTYPLMVIIGGLTWEIYSYSTSNFSINVNTLTLQFLRFYASMTVFAIALFITASLITYLIKKVFKRDINLVKWLSRDR